MALGGKKRGGERKCSCLENTYASKSRLYYSLGERHSSCKMISQDQILEKTVDRHISEVSLSLVYNNS